MAILTEDIENIIFCNCCMKEIPANEKRTTLQLMLPTTLEIDICKVCVILGGKNGFSE